jgi:hypothetical protein
MFITCEYCESPLGSEDYVCPYCYTRQTTPFFQSPWNWVWGIGVLAALAAFLIIDGMFELGVVKSFIK